MKYKYHIYAEKIRYPQWWNLNSYTMTYMSAYVKKKKKKKGIIFKYLISMFMGFSGHNSFFYVKVLLINMVY